MPRRKTLRQYEHDPTRPAYYTKRGFSHREAIKASQAERKQRGIPGLGHALYGPGTRRVRAEPSKPTWEPGWKTLARGAAKAEEPKPRPKPRQEPPRKIARTAHPRDVKEVLGVQAKPRARPRPEPEGRRTVKPTAHPRDVDEVLGVRAEVPDEKGMIVGATARGGYKRREPKPTARSIAAETTRLRQRTVRQYRSGDIDHDEAMAKLYKLGADTHTAVRLIGLGPRGRHVQAGIGAVAAATPTIAKRVASDVVEAGAGFPGGVYAWRHPVRAAKLTAKGVVQDWSHPIRYAKQHPGFALADVVGFAGAGAEVGARGAAVARYAGRGQLGRAAREAVLPSRPAPRKIRVGEQEFTAPASRSALLRGLTQRLVDDIAQRKISRHPEGPEAGLAESRWASAVVRNIEERRRFYGDVVERAPAEALAATRLTPSQQIALRMVAEEITPGEWIAYNERQIAKAKSKETKTRLRLLNRMIAAADKKYVNVVLSDTTGGRFASARPAGEMTTVLKREGRKAAKLNQAWDEIAGSDANRERMLEQLDLIDTERATARKAAPGRLVRGAEYREPTRARLGIPSGSLTQVRARVARLQKLYDREAARSPRVTQVEARLRQARKRYKGESDLIEKYTGQPERQTVREGELRAARRALDLAEQAAREARHELTPRAQRIGGALGVAKEELARLERARASRIEPTGLVGEEELTGGRAYVGSRATGTTTRAGAGRVSGQVLGYEPAVSPELRHAYKGKLREAGLERQATAQLVGEAELSAQRLLTITRELEHLRQVAKIPEYVPEKGRWQPVRMSKKPVSPAAKRALAQINEGTYTLARDEQKALGDLADQILGENLPKDWRKLPADEIGFVPEAMVGSFRTGRLRIPESRVWERAQKIVHAWDAASDVIRLALIYGKVGYIAPNLLGNVTLNAIQQGPLMLPMVGMMAAASRKAPGLMRWVDQQAGGGVVRSIAEGPEAGGAVRRATQRATGLAAQPLNVITDKYTRRLSFLYEVYRSGGQASLRSIDSFINDLKELRDSAPGSEAHERLRDLTERARNSAIEYERLNPAERQIVRRIVFVYPWVKGSLRYAGRMPLEHPIQTAFLARTGRLGQEEAQRQLGPLPTYMQGVFRIGGTRERPTVVDPRSMNPFQTPADVINAISSTVQGRPQYGTLAEFGNPLLTDLALPVLTGRELRYGRQMGAGEVARDFFGTIPAARAISPRKPGETAIYQRTRGQEWGRFLAGGLYPATVSRASLGAKARQQKGEKVARGNRDYREQMAASRAFMKANGYKRLPPEVAQAMRVMRDFRNGYDQHKKDLGVSGLSPKQKASYLLGFVREHFPGLAAAVEADYKRLLDSPEAYEWWYRHEYNQMAEPLHEWRSAIRDWRTDRGANR